MKKTILFLILSSVLLFCSKNPVTKRKQFTAIPDFVILDLSKKAYDEFKEEEKDKILSQTHPTYMRVNNITQKVIKSVENYLAEIGNEKRLKNMEWEIVVVDDTILNAFCMPGGKMAFYTQLIDIATDDELSFVIGHEIAHAIAKHSNEMMSQAISLALAGEMLYTILKKDNGDSDTIYFDETDGENYDDLYAEYDDYDMDDYSYIDYAVENEKDDTLYYDDTLNQSNDSAVIGKIDFLGVAISVATYLGELAFSRNHETEADKMGLIFMDKSGYDIHASVSMWQKMVAKYEEMGWPELPEFLSTHPSDKKRIQNLEVWILEMELEKTKQ